MTDDQAIRIVLTSAATTGIWMLFGGRKSDRPASKPVTRLAYWLGKHFARGRRVR